MKTLTTMTVVLSTIGSLLVASPSQAASNHMTVTGTTVSGVPCAPTTFDPTTSHVTCTGTSTWYGTLTGESVYTADTTYDPVTGAGGGTQSETFTGRSSDGRTGTLEFNETLTTTPTGIPDTATACVVATVVKGTGGFAGARGTMSFYGTVNAVEAITGYRGEFALR